MVVLEIRTPIFDNHKMFEEAFQVTRTETGFLRENKKGSFWISVPQLANKYTYKVGK